MSCGWTQKELASQLGLTPKMVSFYENNERIPPADILVKLSEIFKVTSDYLLGIVEERDFLMEARKKMVNEEENLLLSIYRQLDKDYKDIVIGDIKKYVKMQEYMQTSHSEDEHEHQKKQA